MLKNQFLLPAYANPIPLHNAKNPVAYVDISTNGYHARTSHILSATLTREVEGSWTEYRFAAEDGIESDDYSILEMLMLCLEKAGTIYTFYGTSFLIPFLTEKCRLYRIPNGLSSPDHIDLAALLRPLYTFLHLPSRRMEDYLAVLPDPSSIPPVVALTHLLPYLSILHGKGHVIEIRSDSDGSHIYIDLQLDEAVPSAVSYRAGNMSLHCEQSKATLCATVEDGCIRLYFDTPADYVFLPIEGYAVHRSVASSLPADRAVRCTYDTCYTRIDPNKVTQNADHMETFLRSAFTYIRRTCGLYS